MMPLNKNDMLLNTTRPEIYTTQGVIFGSLCIFH